MHRSPFPALYERGTVRGLGIGDPPVSFPCPVPGCDRRATEWAICRTCAAGLDADLRAIPALVGQVEVTLARQGVQGARGGSRSATPPLPYHPAASAVLGATKAVLVGWVRDVAEDGDEEWPADTAAACAAWLGERIAVLRVHPAAVEITTEIAHCTASCRRVIDSPPQRFFAGPCEECGAPMYARAGAGTVWCRAIDCRRTYDIAERRAHLLAAAGEELLSIPDLLRVLPGWTGAELKGSTLRSWRQRGNLAAAGTTTTGRELFRIGDVVALLGAAGGEAA